jgi:hypothetical protein
MAPPLPAVARSPERIAACGIDFAYWCLCESRTWMPNKDLADEFADSAQGVVRGNPLHRMNARKHPALILKLSTHLQSSHRIGGEMNHHSFALARFFGKLLVRLSLSS